MDALGDDTNMRCPHPAYVCCALPFHTDQLRLPLLTMPERPVEQD